MALSKPTPEISSAPPSFELSEEQYLLQEEVRRFAEERIRPGLAECDRRHQFPSELLRETGEMGLLGMTDEPDCGGAGFDSLSYVVAVEELARVCPSIAVTMSVTNSACCWPISQYADPEFKQCVVPALASGQCLATLDHSRLGIAAQAVGIHQRALELAVTYAKDREQFGTPIAEHQAIRFKISQMATELEAARLLTWSAALCGGRQAGRLAAQAKLYASEAANRACYESLQMHGGYGFSEDYEIARLYRDVRVTTIYEGTSEMQRLVIARHLRKR